MGAAAPHLPVLRQGRPYRSKETYVLTDVRDGSPVAELVRRGLEREGTGDGAFTGVAVYANWVTDERDWDDFRHHWMENE